MNTVLWLMYAADLSTSISAVCVIVAIVTLIVFVVRWLAAATDDAGPGAFSRTMPAKKALWLTITLFGIAAFLPSSKTIYAVAAVQAGDSFAGTARGEKVLKALDSWLEKQDKPD